MRIAHLRHIFETKGAFHGMERLLQIVGRFSFGRRRFRRMLAALENDFSDQDFQMTFCVTASLLEQNLELIQALERLGHEIAAHGFFHTRMSYQSPAQQHESILKSYQAFQDSGIPVEGFRCPYLNFTQDTVKILKSSPYSWTSQHLVYWKNGFNPNTRRLFSLYQASPLEECLSLPRFNDSLLEIPISLPDDEMLVERFRIRKAEEIDAVWFELARRIHQEGELLHLLFHPERFEFIRLPLVETLKFVKSQTPSVWITTLSKLANWWKLRRRVEWKREVVDKTRQRVWVELPPGATVLLKGSGSAGKTPVFRDYYPAQPVQQDDRRFCFNLGEGRRYNIGIAPGCPDSLSRFLAEEGFLVEISENPGVHSCYLHEYPNFQESDQRSLLSAIDACEFPLLRLWRWPRGARSAMAVSSDIDAITLRDFLVRSAHF